MAILDPATAASNRFAFYARVTQRDGRAIEEALAPPTLLDTSARLDGALIEASYAFDDPPLLKRLREERVPRLMDSQSLRFTGSRGLQHGQSRSARALTGLTVTTRPTPTSAR